MSKTILIFDNDTDDIVGYYTITTKSFLLHKMNASKKRKFFGTSQTNGNVLPSILIGQLGKNSATKSNFTGSNLMDCIFRYIFKMSEYTPSVVCYVEHNGSEKLINYYEKHGFTYFERKEEEKNGLFCHMIKTKDIFEMLNHK